MNDEQQKIFSWRILFCIPKHQWVFQVLLNGGLALWGMLAIVGVIRGAWPGIGGIFLLGGVIVAFPIFNTHWRSSLTPYPGRRSLLSWQNRPAFYRGLYRITPFWLLCLLLVINAVLTQHWEWAIIGGGWFYLFACLRVIISWQRIINTQGTN